MEKELNFLLDTNIWLERLLDQERAKDVKNLLDVIPTENLFISDFTLHSIGVILFRLNKASAFHEFIDDLFGRGNLKILSLSPFDQVDLIELKAKQSLDFDDAYQLQVASKFELTLITFDSDFKKSKIKIATPSEIVKMLKK